MTETETAPAKPLAWVRLFIATPAYGGQVTTTYLESLLDAKADLEAHGVRVAVCTIRNESLITRARNGCVARFLAARIDGLPATHLMFIDADVGFPRGAIRRLLSLGEPVVGGAYPMKAVDYDRVAEIARQRPDVKGDLLEPISLSYALNMPPIEAVRDGFVKVYDVGTGFLLLRRDAIETMIEHYGKETQYVNNNAGYEIQGRDHKIVPPLHFHALFECMIDPVTRIYLSEDYAFLRRWRDIGGEVWMDITMPMRHLGSHEWRGHIGHFLEHAGHLKRNQ